VSDCPLIEGNAVRLLPSGDCAMAAIFAELAAARDHIHMEYYTFEDVHAAGTTLGELLLRKLEEGVRVAIIYDAVGSDSTPDAFLEGLGKAGATVLEFRSTNPLRPHFGLRVNDRDHRKLTVVDGRIAFLGGVNISRVYETPRSVGAVPDPDQSFWYDCAVRIEGPAVGEVQKLFHHTWQKHGGAALPATADFPDLPVRGEETIRVDGSAPREKRQLYYESLHAAIEAARDRILLTTGYFVPTHEEWKLIAAAAERGVSVDLILAGHSDVPGAMHAARALYGRLMRRGVRIHELRDGMLHAKAAVIDGVWVAIGSSNLDRRSYVYNNEIDAIVLGHATAASVEKMLRGWIGEAETITLEGWESRSLHERLGELSARVWKRYM
jgi:cardiolipin synthase A/B